MARSRLSKKFEKKSKQTMILSIIGIALLLFILFRYGVPLLSDISFFTGQFIPNKEDVKDIVEDETYVPPPSLNPINKATKEESITVSGIALPGLSVAIYLNGGKIDEVQANETGEFEAEIKLSEGENIIKAKGVSGQNESEFSDSVTVGYKKEGPKLEIEQPKEGETIKEPSQYDVKGKTDPDTTVTVNDFQAIITGDKFSYILTLVNGENNIKIVATDAAGNKTEKTVKFNYSP